MEISLKRLRMLNSRLHARARTQYTFCLDYSRFAGGNVCYLMDSAMVEQKRCNVCSIAREDVPDREVYQFSSFSLYSHFLHVHFPSITRDAPPWENLPLPSASFTISSILPSERFQVKCNKKYSYHCFHRLQASASEKQDALSFPKKTEIIYHIILEGNEMEILLTQEEWIGCLQNSDVSQ